MVVTRFGGNRNRLTGLSGAPFSHWVDESSIRVNVTVVVQGRTGLTPSTRSRISFGFENCTTDKVVPDPDLLELPPMLPALITCGFSTPPTLAFGDAGTEDVAVASLASVAPLPPATFVVLGLGLVAIAIFRTKFRQDSK